jgi:hypothetical protein
LRGRSGVTYVHVADIDDTSVRLCKATSFSVVQKPAGALAH